MKKILVVDDQVLYLKSLELALRKKYQIVTASNYQEALECLKDNVSLALIDIRLDENDDKNIDGLKSL